MGDGWLHVGAVYLETYSAWFTSVSEMDSGGPSWVFRFKARMCLPQMTVALSVMDANLGVIMGTGIRPISTVRTMKYEYCNK